MAFEFKPFTFENTTAAQVWHIFLLFVFLFFYKWCEALSYIVKHLKNYGSAKTNTVYVFDFKQNVMICLSILSFLRQINKIEAANILAVEFKQITF